MVIPLVIPLGATQPLGIHLNWWIWSCQGDVTGIGRITRRNGRRWRLRTGDKRGPALSLTRRTAFIAGLWFIGTFVFSIPAALLYDPVLSDPNYVLGGGADTQVVLRAFLEVLLPIIGPPKSGIARPPRCRPASSLRHGRLPGRDASPDPEGSSVPVAPAWPGGSWT